MSTMLQGPSAVKSSTLVIKGRSYACEAIDPGEEGTAAYRLDKRGRGGARYDVVRTHDGIIKCDCPDYEVRKAGTPAACKPGKALVEAGLLEAPRPVPVKPVVAPKPGKPAVAPITRKDLARAAMFRIKLPDAPMAVEVEAPAPVVAESRAVARPSSPRTAPEPVEAIGTYRATDSGRYIPLDTDDAEHLGYELGNAGERANPPAGWEFNRLVAFYQGWLDGKADLEAQALADMAWIEERERDAFGDPLDHIHPAELVEAIGCIEARQS